MRDNEINDLITTALEITLFGALCIMLTFFSISSRNMFAYKEEQDTLTEILQDQSDKYFLEYGDHIYGTDVVEFILKYNAVYDYYIKLKNKDMIEITKEQAKTYTAMGKDGNEIWSQDYLTNTIFADKIYNEYDIEIIDNGNSLEYYITQK